MSWLDQTLESLAARDGLGYRAGGTPCAEPTALAAMALTAHGNLSAAEAHLVRLTAWQTNDGSVPTVPVEDTPDWTTSLAVTAWAYAQRRNRTTSYRENISAGVRWLLGVQGVVVPQHPGGHDPKIPGWPWVEETHSWVEPTAWALIALKASGNSNHARTIDATKLLIDRLLPGGGCNYGNTVVLGRELRPHVQPTGLALFALRGAADATGRIARSLSYLKRELKPQITPASLAYAMVGLAAHGVQPTNSAAFLAHGAADALERRATLELGLLALAENASSGALFAEFP